MARSTIEPDTIKLWKVVDGNLDVTVSWDAHEITIEDEMNGNRQEWEYDSIRFLAPYDGPADKAQDYVSASEGLILAIAKARAGISSTNDIDRTTEAAINSQMSAVSPVGEQIGILRDQIARMLNGDIGPSEDFTRLNEIAITEIEKAKAVKDAENN